jgi:pimeloyl-ACP methyl ester carboxylesterase
LTPSAHAITLRAVLLAAGLVARLLLLVAAATIAFNVVSFAIAFGRRPRPPRLGAAFLKELLASLVIVPLWPLFSLVGDGWEAAKDGPWAPETRVPVVLLHGYGMNRTNWLWLGPRLSRRGHGPLYGFNYVSLRSVEHMAGELAAFVERVAALEDAERVDIVAHSLGGLVARYFMEKLGGAPRVRRLVTIATPHRGTHMAPFGLGRPSEELRPGSSLLRSLGEPSPKAGYVSVWSRCDNLVVPPESSRLDGAEVVMEDLGHISLLLSPRVADVVAAALEA